MADTEDTSSAGASSGTPSVEEIQVDIEKARAELGETIEALEAKLDVKTRAKNKAAQVKEQATDDQGKPVPAVIIGAVAALIFFGALVVWRQRR